MRSDSLNECGADRENKAKGHENTGRKHHFLKLSCSTLNIVYLHACPEDCRK